MKTQLTVENIKCSGCVNSIKTSLLKLDYIDDVAIDKENSIIILDHHSNIDRNLVIKTLEKMGYPELNNNNLLHKTKSYISCAIGKFS